MNRLSPLITRSIGRHAPPAVVALPAPEPLVAPVWLDDLRLFATGWVGGLIFFGVLLS